MEKLVTFCRVDNH